MVQSSPVVMRLMSPIRRAVIFALHASLLIGLRYAHEEIGIGLVYVVLWLVFGIHQGPVVQN